MDNFVRAIILNSGISFNSVSSFFYILDNTRYNEDATTDMSDTPQRVGNVEQAQPGAVVHFASKNLR